MCYVIWSWKWSWEINSLLGLMGEGSESSNPLQQLGWLYLAFIYSLKLTNCMQLLLFFAIDLLVTQNKFYLLPMEQWKQRKINTWPGIIRWAIIILIPQIPVPGSAKQTSVSMRFNSGINPRDIWDSFKTIQVYFVFPIWIKEWTKTEESRIQGSVKEAKKSFQFCCKNKVHLIHEL